MHLNNRESLILELGFDENHLPRLRSYIDFLWSSNEELNLISRKMTFADLIDNHVVDCLLPLKHFPEQAKAAADFGSGGGLPSVVYAIQFPHIRYHLFEKSALKRAFLEKCKEFAPNLEIHGEISANLPEIDVLTARAFKPLDVILDLSRNYYNHQGSYFLLKGRAEKIQEETQLARKKFKDLQPQVIALQSPVLEVERHLVLINAK